jgi:hypothetical protein
VLCFWGDINFNSKLRGLVTYVLFLISYECGVDVCV